MRNNRKRIVLCPPWYYDIVYELDTNCWMSADNKPDKEKARRQWMNLYEACLAAGLDVSLVPPPPRLPDIVFAANAGMAYGNRFILSNFFHIERRSESRIFRSFLQRFYDKDKIIDLPEGAYFEGQGDALYVEKGNKVFIGHGIRTNLWGVKAVEKIIRSTAYGKVADIISLEMKPPSEDLDNCSPFYHLDTCLLYLPHVEKFIVFEDAFTEKAIATLKEHGDVFSVSREEARQFVCNGLVVDRRTVFLPWVNERIERFLNESGYKNVHQFPMSEFIKSGGAVKCLVLEL